MPDSKVHVSNMDKDQEMDASHEDAVRMVAEAVAQGSAVIDRRTGLVIDKLGPGVDDILIVSLVDGG